MRRAGRAGLASARIRSSDGSAGPDELVGTRDALVVPGREIPWEQILRADWDGETETLTVMLVEPEVLVYELDEPALLLQLVRERVTASIVLTRRVVADGDLGVTLMVRRPPRGGDVTFTCEYDPGLDPESASAQRAAQDAVRIARDELGL